MPNNLDIGKYVPLRTVVSMFLDQVNWGMEEFDRAWIMAFRGLAKVNYSFSALPKTVRLPVNANKTIDIPPDFLMWSKIGVMDELGRLNSLRINNSISTLRDDNPNRLNYLTTDINTSVGDLFTAPFFFNFYNNGIFYNMFFGVQGGLLTYGECRFDEKNRVIIVNHDFKYNEVLLEYVSAPERDGDYVIDSILQECIIAFMAWQFKKDTRDNFYGCCVEARRSMPGKRVELSKINEVIRQTVGQYLKA